ncbi:hypothetical protein IQ03_01005 [Gemmobacter caeni]|uniref:Uncharacterized protein n=2 Tax=Gemmobacter caeni TaxID=589035 RepID=A0A2T6B776_9RHOB|nr:hypothetical protein C8N34_103424 [Gemmobacter caeni]TWJ04045.1 hypothetical protein IQ03_01005 [Gemmobacter caeni]
MTFDYSESEIQEALDELVATGQVVREGDGYYVPEEAKDFGPTTTEEKLAIETLIAAFDLAQGDFVSMSCFDDRVEIQVNRAVR